MSDQAKRPRPSSSTRGRSEMESLGEEVRAINEFMENETSHKLNMVLESLNGIRNTVEEVDKRTMFLEIAMNGLDATTESGMISRVKKLEEFAESQKQRNTKQDAIAKTLWTIFMVLGIEAIGIFFLIYQTFIK